jgi:signal transduction histidine kinase
MAEAVQVRLQTEANHDALVRLEPDSASTLLSNLLVNALQHTPPGRIVTIRVQRKSDTVNFEVEDQGEGIAPEDISHVFERFYRGDRSRSRLTGGTGLGLAICKVIVESCGGKIGVRSQLGQGTCFEVTLPAAEPSDLRPKPVGSEKTGRHSSTLGI